jgi:hypothetical protein
MLEPTQEKPESPAGAFKVVFRELQRLIAAGDLEAARKYGRLTEFTPESEAECTKLDTVLSKIGLVAQAIVATERFLRSFPESPIAHLNLAQHYYNARRLDAAQAEIDKALLHPPALRKFWNQSSTLIWHLRNWPLLLEVSDAGLRLDPSNPRLHIAKGLGLQHAGKYVPAEASWNLALSNAVGDLESCLQLTFVTDRFNYPVLAQKAFQQSLDFALEHNDTKNWLKLASFVSRCAHNLSRVDSICDVALGTAPLDREVLLAVFNVAFAARRFDAALQIGSRLRALEFSTPAFVKKFDFF